MWVQNGRSSESSSYCTDSIALQCTYIFLKNSMHSSQLICLVRRVLEFKISVFPEWCRCLYEFSQVLALALQGSNSFGARLAAFSNPLLSLCRGRPGEASPQARREGIELVIIGFILPFLELLLDDKALGDWSHIFTASSAYITSSIRDRMLKAKLSNTLE